MTLAFEDEYERRLAEDVQKVLSKSAPPRIRTKRRIEHRPFALPSPSLSNPKLTARKMEKARCRICLHAKYQGPPYVTRHHLVPESWFLGQPEELRAIRNAHANIIPLCRACHDEVDNRGPVAKERARRKLRMRLLQDEIAFAIQVRGREWLENSYPSL